MRLKAETIIAGIFEPFQWRNKYTLSLQEGIVVSSMAKIGKHRKQLSEKEEEKNKLCVKVISAIDFSAQRSDSISRFWLNKNIFSPLL